MDNKKYVVLKRSDWETCMMGLSLEVDASIVEDIQSYVLPDAVVLRRQDAFAAAALHTYASSMSLGIALMPKGEQRDRLQEIADYFHCQANLADDEASKIPD